MAFKIGDELINMIGDFANMNRSPDFKVKTNENQQRAAKTRAGRHYSLNLAVGISDEIPRFSEANTRGMRRQSADRVLRPSRYPISSKRTSSSDRGMVHSSTDPIDKHTSLSNIRGDIKEMPKTHGIFRNFSPKDKSSSIEECEETVSPSAITDNGGEVVRNHKVSVKSDGSSSGADNTSSVNLPISPSSSLRAKIISDTGHRGSIILIEDNDETIGRSYMIDNPN
ncbi:unnamed protein product [Litomosoides sigmodontis]|uniref:Uncharacterized protein n=1 Tax=Litomosoides sigmodontis TaxID=42156 RepID=A0A3P6V3F7_LITSI|nr:unnamed protein product [Litomosoides sigmodontis]